MSTPLVDFEMVAPDRILVTGEGLTAELCDLMRAETTVVRSRHEVEMSVADYEAVAVAAPEDKRLVPPHVLDAAIGTSRKWNEDLDVERLWEKKTAPFLSKKQREKLMPHQRVAIVKALLAKRFFVADDMGLGKTATAIACVSWLHAKKRDAKVLVVCPKRMRLNWAHEFLDWTERGVRVVIRKPSHDPEEVVAGAPSSEDDDDGATPSSSSAETFGDSDESKPVITITSYSATMPVCRDLFKELFEDAEWDFVIFDELHAEFGSASSQRSNMLALARWSVGRKTERVLLLSGSPSGPQKLYVSMQLLYPGSMSFGEYERHFCDGHHDGGLWVANGVSRTKELAMWFARRSVRRLKSVELADKLPPITVQIVRFRFPTRLLGRYRALEIQRRNAFRDKDAATHPSVVKEKTLLIKRLTNDMYREITKVKLPECIKWIRAQSQKLWVEKKQKTAVFTHHESARVALASAFPYRAVTISGSTNERVAFERIARLKSLDDDGVILGSLSNRACGAGISLCPAVTLLIKLEQDWAESIDAQVSDRIYRLGAIFPCRQVFLIAEETMDERVYERVEEKYRMTTEIVDGEAKRRRIDVETTVVVPG